MKIFRRQHIIRRYSPPIWNNGYSSIPYEDLAMLMDVQTTEDAVQTSEDGARSIQRLKTFCDEPILVEDQDRQQKADRLWFQGKWFECQSSRLSENTPLRHFTSTFIECLDKEGAPE